MKSNRYMKLIFVLTAIIAVATMSCKDDNDETVSVALDNDLLSLVIGTRETLTVTVTPNNAAVTWISGNPEVVTVIDGVVTAVGVGKTVVNAKAGNSTASCDIIVTLVPVPVTSISLQEPELVMAVGDMETLSFELEPLEATNRRVTWSSSNNNIATVNPRTGEITAIALGEVIITATTADGAKTDECVVTVSPVLELISPGANTTISFNLLNPEEKFTFSWETFPEISEYIIKFSMEEDFETPIFSVETTEGSVDVLSYSLNEFLKERLINTVPLYWTVEPVSSSIKVIPKTNTLNIIPDRHEFLSLVIENASGMTIDKLTAPYQFSMNMTGASSVNTVELTKDIHEDFVILCFNYKSNMELAPINVSLYKAGGTLATEPIEVTGLSQSNEWNEWGVLIDFPLYDWGTPGDYLKFEFDNAASRLVEINGIHFREITAKEYVPQYFAIRGHNAHLTLQPPVVPDVTPVPAEWTIVTAGNDPLVNLTFLDRTLPPEATILTFEYISPQTMTNHLQIYFGPNLSEVRSTGGRLGTVPPADTWTERTYDLESEFRNAIWGVKGDFMRLDFGNQAGYNIQIRNIRIELKK